MQVATNIDIERIAVLPGDCPGDYPVVNDFHASESRFMNRCAYAAYVADHMEQPGTMPIMNIPNTEAPCITEVRLQGTGDRAKEILWGNLRPASHHGQQGVAACLTPAGGGAGTGYAGAYSQPDSDRIFTGPSLPHAPYFHAQRL